MKRFATASVLALVAVAGFAFAGGGYGDKAKEMGKEAAAKQMDIIDTAVANGNFKTLAAALTAAGLVEPLKGKGPFTVFAPTDEAFAKSLPAGTVEELLKPENKEKLASILKFHVVEGNVTSDQIVKMKETSATLMGQTLVVEVKDGKVTIGSEPRRMGTVTAADIKATNGTIHVIDTVLMPR